MLTCAKCLQFACGKGWKKQLYSRVYVCMNVFYHFMGVNAPIKFLCRVCKVTFETLCFSLILISVFLIRALLKHFLKYSYFIINFYLRWCYMLAISGRIGIQFYLFFFLSLLPGCCWNLEILFVRWFFFFGFLGELFGNTKQLEIKRRASKKFGCGSKNKKYLWFHIKTLNN